MMKQKIVIVSDPIPIKLSTRAINESISEKAGRMIFRTILQRADAKNENTRIYRRPILEREVSTYVEGPIAEKRAYGELDHSDKMVVEFKNVCLHINEISWEGDEVWGQVEVLDTPSGKILQECLKKGFSVGISSRGIGSVTELDEGTVEVDDDFTLLCWDAVTNPSTHGAFFRTNKEKIHESTQVKKESNKVDEVISDILCMNLGYCSCQIKV
jgi:hypothetical protein